MHRRYAFSLGAIAFALVTARGAIDGALVSEVVVKAIIALVVFAMVGGVAGAIADYLVKQDLEERYRRRVAWYREGLEQQSADRK
jgi:uncharacterized membrane protein